MPTVDNEIILRTQDKIVDGDLIPRTRPSPRERPLHFRSVLLPQIGGTSLLHFPRSKSRLLTQPVFDFLPSRAGRPTSDCPFRGGVISTLLFIQIWLQSVIIYIYHTPCHTISTLLAREACRASKSVDISRGLPRVISTFSNTRLAEF